MSQHANADVRVAPPPQNKYVPAYTVERLPGKKPRPFIKYVDGKRIEYEKEVDAGYMVKFSRGHSIHVWTDSDLKRLGYDQAIPLVDGESIDNDHVGVIPNTVKK